MWDIKSFSTVPQCSRAKTEKARGGEKKNDKIKRQSGRVSESGKGRRGGGGADEKSERRGGNSHYFELIKYFSEGRIEGR